MKIVVIPDVHGRSTWKKIISIVDQVDFVVFLGDYLDQPKDSLLSNKICLDNFEEIIEFAKQKNNVKLLIGNHDFHYIVYNVKYTGYRSSYKYKFQELYQSNSILFSLHFGVRSPGDGTKVIFSHAGILPGWLRKVNYHVNQVMQQYETLPEDLISNLDNVLPIILNSRLVQLLDNCSPIRLGTSEFGSLIWADKIELEQWVHQEDEFKNTIQVVGHSSIPVPTGVFSSKNRGALFLDCWDYTNDIILVDLSSEFVWRQI
jgi:Icc-related predicted phosphoesterase